MAIWNSQLDNFKTYICESQGKQQIPFSLVGSDGVYYEDGDASSQVQVVVNLINQN
jgi:hypothetical protein